MTFINLNTMELRAQLFTFINGFIMVGVDIRKIYIDTLTGIIKAEVADNDNIDTGFFVQTISLKELFSYYFNQLKLHSTFGIDFEVAYDEGENRINILKSNVPV